MTDRFTASTITDDQLDALYAERDRLIAQLNGLREVARQQNVRLHAEVERLTELTAQYADRAIANGKRAEQAEAAIARVRGLHRKATHGDDCVYCVRGNNEVYDVTWPCDTVAALDGPQTADGAVCGSYVPPTGKPEDSGCCARCGMYDWRHQSEPPADAEAGTCDASDTLPSIGQAGPCVLRHDHDGPWHKDANGMQWAPNPDAPLPSPLADVQGRCPACGSTSLFLGEGGYVTCRRIGCPCPDAASTLLENDLAQPDDETAQCPKPDPHAPHMWTWREEGVDCLGLPAAPMELGTSAANANATTRHVGTCLGYETEPNRCTCGCEGCTHNCGACVGSPDPHPENAERLARLIAAHPDLFPDPSPNAHADGSEPSEPVCNCGDPQCVNAPAVAAPAAADDDPCTVANVRRLMGARVDNLTARAEQAEAERDGAYRERAHLVAHLAALHPSHIGHTDPWAPDWAVVIIETPTGQMSWHIAERDMDLFEHVQPTNRICRGWDGHTTEEKYERLRQLIAAPITASTATALLAALDGPQCCGGGPRGDCPCMYPADSALAQRRAAGYAAQADAIERTMHAELNRHHMRPGSDATKER